MAMAADYFGSCLVGTWLTRPKRKRKKKDILEKARKRVVDPETILQKEFGPWSLRNYGGNGDCAWAVAGSMAKAQGKDLSTEAVLLLSGPQTQTNLFCTELNRTHPKNFLTRLLHDHQPSKFLC